MKAEVVANVSATTVSISSSEREERLQRLAAQQQLVALYER